MSLAHEFLMKHRMEPERIAPAEQAPAKASSGGASAGSDVDAVLREAVAALTGGRGHIVKVTKL